MPSWRALAAVALGWIPPTTMFSSLPTGVAGSVPTHRTCLAGLDGRYELPRVPALPGGTVLATLESYEDVVVDVPEAVGGGQFELDFQLERLDDSAINGYVFDTSGAPVSDASVTLGHHIARTNADGQFRLPLTGSESEHVLVAAANGFLPADFAVQAPGPGQSAEWPDDVALFVEGTPLSIAGTVVDADGEPIPFARVWPIDLTPFASGDQAGASSGSTHPPISIEHLLAPRDESWAFDVESDADGRFIIEGLLPRPYRLASIDLATLVRSASAPIDAGTTDARLLCDVTAARTVRGRVLDHLGEPLAGIRMAPGVVTNYVDTPSGNNYSAGQVGPAVHTNDDGTFTFERVTVTGLQLAITGSQVFDDIVDVRAGANYDALDLVASRRCNIRVELTNNTLDVNGFCVLEGEGRVLGMQHVRGRGFTDIERAGIANGSSEVTAVPGNARYLLLLRENEEVARLPLGLDQAKGEGSL